MNSEGGSTFEVPLQPEVPEQPPAQGQEQVVERQRPAAQEAGVGKRAPQPRSTAVPDTTAIPIPSAPAPPPAGDQAQKGPVSPVTADLPAHDADLIEKEWIERAKSIVAKTRDDPHLQKTEMSKVKADYIQKRFNKTIKTDEATA